jgi:hypothetical protein
MIGGGLPLWLLGGLLLITINPVADALGGIELHISCP